MISEERKEKLELLPWQALYDFLISCRIEETEIKNKEKSVLLEHIVKLENLTDDKVDQLVEKYIYGNRITFTIWKFTEALNEKEIGSIQELKEKKEWEVEISGFRNFRITSVEKYENRQEILYEYSKEYSYVNEEEKKSRIWELHRGCVWIGIEQNYVASISKHEKMTKYVMRFLGNYFQNQIKQIKPPKQAMDRCVDSEAISRIVLQGEKGEKTVVSNALGLTEEQKVEVDQVSPGRFVPAGSYRAKITEDITTTVKYNLNRGTIGIYKYLPVDILFSWTESTIGIILDEIERLKGRPVEEICAELGIEIKWSGASDVGKSHLNWYLTQLIASLDQYEDIICEIPEEYLEILQNKKWFYKIPRGYCEQCEVDVVPICQACGAPLQISEEDEWYCRCGAPCKACCSEGHTTIKKNTWFVPTKKLIDMFNRNIRKIYSNEDLNYHFCIMGSVLHLNYDHGEEANVEIPFTDIDCFQWDSSIENISENVKNYTILLKEKCDSMGHKCTKENINKCLCDNSMMCLPKLFYGVIPSYRPQTHHNGEYGDISGQITVRNHHMEMKGIIKSNTANKSNKTVEEMKSTILTASTKEGREMIQQFVDQGMVDNRCKVIAVVAPQYFDHNLKGTLRYLARLADKKVVFIQLDELCKLVKYKKLVD